MNADQARTAVTDALTRVAPECDLSTVDPGASLRDELDIDSLDFLTLVERLHETTGVDIPDTDYGRVGTLDDLVAYLASR